MMKIEKAAAFAGLVTIFAGAVAAYHKMDQANALQQLDNIESGVIVDRIVRLNKIECSRGLSTELEFIRQQQLTRYHELTGREFSKPPCNTD